MSRHLDQRPEEPLAPAPAFKRPSPWNKIDEMKRGGTAPLSSYKKVDTQQQQDMSTTAGSHNQSRQKVSAQVLATQQRHAGRKSGTPLLSFIDKHKLMFAAGGGGQGGSFQAASDNFKKRVEARASDNRVSMPGKISPYIQNNMAETLTAIFGRKERKPVRPMRKIRLKGISDGESRRQFKSYLFGAVPGDYSALGPREDERGDTQLKRKKNIEMLLEGMDGTSTIQSFIHQNQGFKTYELDGMDDKWGTGKLVNFYEPQKQTQPAQDKEFMKTESILFKDEPLGRTDTLHPLNYFSDSGNQQEPAAAAFQPGGVKRNNTSEQQIRSSLSSNRKQERGALGVQRGGERGGGAGSGSGRPVVRNVVRRKPSKVRVRRLFLEEKKTGGTDSDGEPVPQDLVEQTQKFQQFVERPPARHKAIPIDIDDGGCPFVVKSASFIKAPSKQQQPQVGPLAISSIAAAQSAQLERPPSRHKTPPKGRERE